MFLQSETKGLACQTYVSLIRLFRKVPFSKKFQTLFRLDWALGLLKAKIYFAGEDTHFLHGQSIYQLRNPSSNCSPREPKIRGK